MGRLFSGDGDVNIVGIVGSTRSDRDDNDGNKKTSDKETTKGATKGATNTGIIHTGRGEVWINGKRQ